MTRTAAVIVLAAVTPVMADLTADQTPFHTYRGLWVDRFDYNSADKINSIFLNARDLGITDIMFQVRGQADAYYFRNNGLEVHASRVSESYDPLGIAIAAGQSSGIRVHAWLNMSPLWNGATAPSNPDHLYNKHPEFRIRDANNVEAPLGSGYVTVNPTRQDVQDHIASVVRTVATNYDVDGIHLDYIRLTKATPGSSTPMQYPRDPATVAEFQKVYPGVTPTANPGLYESWVASRITDLVRNVREATKTSRPDAQLTAAVWRDASIGLDHYQQDWARWADLGLLDAAIPMIYRQGFAESDSGDLYRTNSTSAVNHKGNSGIIIGLGTYMQSDPDLPGITPEEARINVLNQLEYAKSIGANGVQIFDAGTLFSSAPQQVAVREAMKQFFAANDQAPAPTVITDFEIDEGYFRHAPTTSASNENVIAGTAERTTSQFHGGGAAQRIAVTKANGAPHFLLRHLSGNPGAGNFTDNLQRASEGSIGFWLKTATPDLQVSIGLDDTTTGDRSYFKNVIADNLWHKYEWYLNDVTHWDAWRPDADGKIASIFATDSIHFLGTTASAEIFLDDVFHDAAAIAPNQWTGVSGTKWRHAGNWTGGAAYGPSGFPSAVGATANFLRRATAPTTVTIEQSVTVGTINFDNTSPYTLAGPGVINLDVATQSASINILNRGVHTIAAALAIKDNTILSIDRGSTLTLSGGLITTPGRLINRIGDGTLVLSGVQTYGANSSLVLNRGHTRMESDMGSGGRELTLTVNHNSGVAPSRTTVQFASSQTLKSLIINNGLVSIDAGQRKVLDADQLVIATQGKVDLADNAIILRDSVAPDIRQSLISGRGVAPGGVAAGNWNGFTGIISSAANQAFTQNGKEVFSIGYARNGDLPLGQFSSFAGRDVFDGDVLVSLTRNGDANLDGMVNNLDITILAGFYKPDHNPIFDGVRHWYQADFNYDGIVNNNDITILAGFYNPVAAPPWPTAAGSILPVPEPALTFPLLLVSSACLHRRRQTHPGVRRVSAC